jgi:hypothetical protein
MLGSIDFDEASIARRVEDGTADNLVNQGRLCRRPSRAQAVNVSVSTTNVIVLCVFNLM